MPLANLISREMSEWTKGFIFAHLSQIAYDTIPERRRQRFAGLGFEEIAAYEGDDAAISGLEAYVLTSSSSNVVVVRGSQENIDWVQNARFIKTRYEGVWIHQGFADMSECFITLMDSSGTTFESSAPVWLTGHSLGGAIAQVLGYVLNQKGHEIASVVTFGSPRVGGGRLWKRRVEREGLESRYVRWVNDLDVVPRVPYTGMGYDPLVGSIPIAEAAIKLLTASPKEWIWKHVGRANIIDHGARRVEFDGRMEPWAPLSLVYLSGFEFHPISGLKEGDEHGYIRDIYRFMPSTEKDQLLANAGTNLSTSALALSGINEQNLPAHLSGFGPLTLEEAGLLFR